MNIDSNDLIKRLSAKLADAELTNTIYELQIEKLKAELENTQVAADGGEDE